MTRLALAVALLMLMPALSACLGDDDVAPAATDGDLDPEDAPFLAPAPTPSPDGSGGVAAGGFSDTHVFPGDYDTSGRFSVVLRSGPHAILPPEVHELESSVDGVTIQVAVVRPDGAAEGSVPVILVASPYFSAFTPDRITGKDQETIWDGYTHLMYKLYAENFVPHGYALALVAVRGTGGSGGCSDLFGPKESADLDQAVTWVGTRAWSSGNVGMIGLSYPGSTPWQVAGLGNPHLKTIVPVSGINDLYPMLYANGTFNVGSYGYATFYYHTMGFANQPPVISRDAATAAEAVVCQDVVESYANTALMSATLARDAYFEARDWRQRVIDNYDGSVFLVHGLTDERVPPSQAHPFAERLRAADIPLKELLGQWSHSYPDLPDFNGPENTRWDWAEVLLHWFDYWLKEDPTVDLGPRVQVQDSDGAWRSEEQWPPADAVHRVFHLAPGGGLTDAPANDEEAVLVGPDVNGRVPPGTPPLGPEVDAAPCAACPAFLTDALPESLRLVGRPTLHATVTPKGPGGHLLATLVVVEGDAERAVGYAQLDLRVADGSEGAEVVVPGEALVARLQFQPLDVHVPPGARLGVRLTQGTYWENMPSHPTYPVEVHVGGDASVLTALTVARSPAVFFTPPA